VEQVQHGLDRLVQASIDRLAPVRKVRDEMAALRSRLEELESSLSRLEREEALGAPETVGALTGKVVLE
jgi:BMFP domain-containing protein YqiC